ncbi:hypothetical protein [Nostoc sp.]|uniref:hypothetical protein n=1 Tax=Nostoc sp. TaxID=1180 RepID=UPI002FF9319A
MSSPNNCVDAKRLVVDIALRYLGDIMVRCALRQRTLQNWTGVVPKPPKGSKIVSPEDKPASRIHAETNSGEYPAMKFTHL